MLLLICAYNHYIHHVLAQKYHTKCKIVGENQQAIETHNASGNHTRVSTSDSTLQCGG